MKKINLRKVAVAVVVLSLLCCSAAWAKLPKTYKEFKARYQTEGKTMEGAVKLYFEGVFAFIDPDTRAEAGRCCATPCTTVCPLRSPGTLPRLWSA